MLKIEQQMIAAIRDRKAWRSGNTTVAIEHTPEGLFVKVYLHGNHVATVGPSRVTFTLAGWPTPTTRSRINAILREFIHGNAGVYQSAGVQFYRSPDCWDGSPIPNDAWTYA